MSKFAGFARYFTQCAEDIFTVGLEGLGGYESEEEDEDFVGNQTTQLSENQRLKNVHESFYLSDSDRAEYRDLYHCFAKNKAGKIKEKFSENKEQKDEEYFIFSNYHCTRFYGYKRIVECISVLQSGNNRL